MSEKSYAEWQKAFSDILESIELLYKNGVDYARMEKTSVGKKKTT